MLIPDWKIKHAERCFVDKTTSGKPDVDNLLSVLNGTCDNPVAEKEVKAAYSIYKKQPFVREILEACLLCDDYTTERAREVTGIPPLTIETYSEYFFDLNVFAYKLQRFEYVKEFDVEGFPDARLFKQWALSAGISSLLWRFNPTKFEMPPERVVASLMADAFFRAKEHINESITSSKAKESLRWVKQALDSVGQTRIVGNSSSENLLEEFKAALEYDDETVGKGDVLDAEIVE